MQSHNPEPDSVIRLVHLPGLVTSLRHINTSKMAFHQPEKVKVTAVQTQILNPVTL